jgi:prepilin signal peptidase PulO-like enzyme (type II secretory pathway)
VLTAVIFSDLQYQEIPYVFSIVTAGLVIALKYNSFLLQLLNYLLIACFIIFIMLLSKFYYKKEVFGGADILLFLIFAFYFNTANFIAFFFFSFFVGTIFSLGLLLIKKAQKNSMIPFAPFIVIAFFIVDLFGDFLLAQYWRLLGV